MIIHVAIKGGAYGTRTIQSTIFFRKFLPNHLYSINLCQNILDTIEPLQATGDPYDPFALQKACLLACGIIPREGHTLGEILERLGSGFVMHSEVTNVPKGSGLGTSSILSAACVKAVFEFMGIAYTEDRNGDQWTYAWKKEMNPFCSVRQVRITCGVEKG